MSVAEDFIGQMITETASGDRCEKCGFPIYEAPGCQCEDLDDDNHYVGLDYDGDGY